MVEVHCFCFLVIELQSYFPAFQLDRLQKILRLFDIISQQDNIICKIEITDGFSRVPGALSLLQCES